MKKARKFILAMFAVIGLVTITWTMAHLGRAVAQAGEPKPLPIPKAEGLGGAVAPQKVIPTTKCETVVWRQFVGEASTGGTDFVMTKLSVDGGAYVVFTSEHGVFVIKE